MELMSQAAIAFLKSNNEYLWPATINIDQWFESGVNAHVHHETHLWAPAEMLTESKKEDRSNETYSLGHKANLVAPNGNNNNNNNNIDTKDVNMLDSSDDESELELEHEMSDEEYD